MIRIGHSVIGNGHPVFIIAELSGNHNKDFDCAVELIKKSAEAGADAIKIQTYTPDTITLDCDNEQFHIGCDGKSWEGKRLYDLYSEAFMPWEWQPDLKKVAEGLGIPLFSTPFDPTSFEFLEKMNVPAYKIASFEIIDLPLLRRVAEVNKPVIISTGMASISEIEDAIQTIRSAGNNDIVLLKCTSAYPASLEDMNLKAIPFMKEKFGVEVGLSDHSLGIIAPIAAVSLGACIIEKHITLSRERGGVDSQFSLEPHEFKRMTKAIRQVEEALGHVSFEPSQNEKRNRIFRRSLYAIQDIREGETFTHENIRSIRPGFGLSPKNLTDILGKKASRNISRGTPIQWSLVLDRQND